MVNATKQEPKKKEEAKKATSFKKLILFLTLSIGVLLIGVFVEKIGDTFVKDYVASYFESPPAKVQQETKSESHPEPPPMDWHSSPLPGAVFLTDNDIRYIEGGRPYLVIIGHVFDVTSGFKSYLPGSGYHGFIGQDASRAFVSGEFNKAGLIDDLTGLSSSDYAGLEDWLGFYVKTYPFVGYHYGRFFSEEKRATSDFQDFLKMLDVAEEEKRAKENVYKEFPSCNVEWSEKDGTNVWCSTKSGGVSREWTGYPALFKETANKDPRCACVLKSQLTDPRIKRYHGCDVKAHRCNGVGK